MLGSGKGTIVYVGGFELPDKNAAAHRVLNNGKILREMGWNVVFIGISREESIQGENTLASGMVQGFLSYHVPYPNNNRKWLKYLTDATFYIRVCEKIKASAIIFYNFQAPAMAKLMKYCKRKGMKCYSDVTEWYALGKGSIPRNVLKWLDTTYRMRVLNKHTDGVIAISRYLESYYGKSGKVTYVPPLTDCADPKFKGSYLKSNTTLRLVYAGSPGQKDRIDYLIRALSRVKRDYFLDVFGITLDEFSEIYPSEKKLVNKKIVFHGKTEHMEVIKYIKAANYSCFFREENRVSKAGFPTKFAESISCGTAVITNKSSNLEEYMKNNMNGILLSCLDEQKIANAIECAEVKCDIQRNLFDYHNYINAISYLIGGGGISEG